MFAKIKAFFIWKKLETEALREVRVENNITKPGWQTTEFWTKNLTQIVTLAAMAAAMSGHNVTPEQQAAVVVLGIKVVAGLEGLYGLYRTVVKFIAHLKETKGEQPK